MKHCCCALIWVCAVAAQAADFDSEKLQNWHQWRGPESTGVAPLGNPPVQWDEDTNIRWKAEIPGAGSSTPIIWGDQVFILTAVKTDRQEEAPPAEVGTVPGGNPFRIQRPTHYYQFIVMCLNRRTGDVEWQHLANEQVPHEGSHHDHGFASGSPTTDGKHLFASFGSRGLYCYDMDGNLKWDRDFGQMKMIRWFGEAVSPVLDGDSLFVNTDHEGQSLLLSLDAETGETKWQVDREEQSSWVAPLVVEREGRKQVIVNSNLKARGYDFETGDVLWECGGQTLAIIPMPVATEELVFCMSGYPKSALFAIPLDAEGDITDSDAIAWQRDRDTPYCPSPLLYGDRLYFNKTNSAILTCLDAATGDTIIEKQRLQRLKKIYASPVGAADRVYFVGRDGTTTVLKNSAEYEVLATNELDAEIDASPAIVGDELFLRGKKHLYSIVAN